MSDRTNTRTVVFPRQFLLTGMENPRPAGEYVIEIDEETIEGVSFLVYRRTSTRLRLPPDQAHPGVSETITVDQAELDAALLGGAP